MALAPAVSPLATATLHQVSPSEFQLQFATLSGQSLSGAQSLPSLELTAVGNGLSAFLPLGVFNVAATQADGVALGRTLGGNGRVVFVNQVPLLEAGLNNNQTQIMLYGPSGPSYTLESASSLRLPLVWSSIWNGAIDASLYQIIVVDPTNSTSFYRATVP